MEKSAAASKTWCWCDSFLPKGVNLVCGVLWTFWVSVLSSPGKISKLGFALLSYCLLPSTTSQPESLSLLHSSCCLAAALHHSRDCISVAEPSFIWCPGKEALQAAGVATWDLFLLCVMSRSINHPAEAVYVSLAIALEVALFLEAGITTS